MRGSAIVLVTSVALLLAGSAWAGKDESKAGAGGGAAAAAHQSEKAMERSNAQWNDSALKGKARADSVKGMSSKGAKSVGKASNEGEKRAEAASDEASERADAAMEEAGGQADAAMKKAADKKGEAEAKAGMRGASPGKRDEGALER